MVETELRWTELFDLSSKVRLEVRALKKSLKDVRFEATSRNGVVKVVMVDDYIDSIVVREGKHSVVSLAQDVMEAANAAEESRMEKQNAGMEEIMAKLGLQQDLKLPF